MHRRNFLALIGASVTGVWLNGVGLIQLPRNMVISVKKGLRIGRGHQSSRKDLQWMYWHLFGNNARWHSNDGRSAFAFCADWGDRECNFDRFWPGWVNPQRKAPQTRAEMKSFIDQLYRLLDQSETKRDSPKKSAERSCSFCDLQNTQVKKLIASSLQSSICDLCIGDAAALLSMHS